MMMLAIELRHRVAIPAELEIRSVQIAKWMNMTGIIQAAGAGRAFLGLAFVATVPSGKA